MITEIWKLVEILDLREILLKYNFKFQIPAFLENRSNLNLHYGVNEGQYILVQCIIFQRNRF